MQSACPALVPEDLGESHPKTSPRLPALPPRRSPQPAAAPAPASAPRSRLWSFPLLAFLGMSVCAVLFLLQFSRIVQLQYDLAAKTGVRDQLLQENAELHLGIEQLSALNRVEQQAHRLGMVQPESWLLLELPQVAGPALDGEMAAVHSHRVAR